MKEPLSTFLTEIERLESLKLSKTVLPALRTLAADGNRLVENLISKSQDTSEIEELEECKSTLDSSLSELEDACESFESADDKEEREDAISDVENALAEIKESAEAIAAIPGIELFDLEVLEKRVEKEIAVIREGSKSEMSSAVKTLMSLGSSQREKEVYHEILMKALEARKV